MDPNTTNLKGGPALLNERSISGIAVHLLALFTGIVGAGLVYLVSNQGFTRENARNALNWHLSMLALTVVAFVTFLLGADTMTIGGEVVQWSPLPDPVATVVGLLGTLLLLAAGLGWVLTWIFASIATVKAIFGTPWEYPLSPELVHREAL